MAIHKKTNMNMYILYIYDLCIYVYIYIYIKLYIYTMRKRRSCHRAYKCMRTSCPLVTAPTCTVRTVHANKLPPKPFILDPLLVPRGTIWESFLPLRPLLSTGTPVGGTWRRPILLLLILSILWVIAI